MKCWTQLLEDYFEKGDSGSLSFKVKDTEQPG